MLKGGELPPPRPRKPESMNSMIRPGMGHNRQDSEPLPPPPTLATKFKEKQGFLYIQNQRGMLGGLGPRLWSLAWVVVRPSTGVITSYKWTETDLGRKRNKTTRPDLEGDTDSDEEDNEEISIDMLSSASRHEAAIDNILRVVPVLNKPSRFNILFRSGFVYNLKAKSAIIGRNWVEYLQDVLRERMEMGKPTGGRIHGNQPALASAAANGGALPQTRQSYADSLASDSDDSAEGFYFDDDLEHSGSDDESDSESDNNSDTGRDILSLKKVQKLISRRMGTKDKLNWRTNRDDSSDSNSSSTNPATPTPTRLRYKVPRKVTKPAKKEANPANESSGSEDPAAEKAPKKKGKGNKKKTKKKSKKKAHRKTSSKSSKSSKSSTKSGGGGGKRPGLTTGNPKFGSRRLRVSAPGFPVSEINLVHGEQYRRPQALRSTFVVDTNMLSKHLGEKGRTNPAKSASTNVAKRPAPAARKRRRSRARRRRPRLAVVPKLVEDESSRSLLDTPNRPSRISGPRKLASMALRRTSAVYATKKNKQTRQLLREVIESSRLNGKTVVFEDLDKNGVAELVNSMHRVDVHAGDIVVRQGVSSDTFYIIEKGTFKFFSRSNVKSSNGFIPPTRAPSEKSMNATTRQTTEDYGDILATQGPRTFFGELSMLYEQPGNITVQAVGNGVLWALKRNTFHNITTTAAVRKHNDRLRYLNNIPLIHGSLDAMSIIALADAMESESYRNREEIVPIGEPLSKMYVVEEGVAAVVKSDGSIVDELKVGDYYGEWALLEPEALSENRLIGFGPKTVMLSLDIAESEELIGPLREKVANRVGNAVFSDANRRKPNEKLELRHPSVANESLRNSSLWRPSLTNQTFGSGMESSIFDSIRLSGSLSEFDPDQEQAVSLALEDAKLRFSGRKQHYSSSLNDKRFMSGTSDAKSSGPSTQVSTRHTRASSQVMRDSVRKTLEGTIASMVGAEENQEVLDQAWTESEPLFPDIDIDDLVPVRLLGRGSFGRVHLTVLENEGNGDDTDNSLYALKVISRSYIVQNGWEKLIMNERAAMLELSQHVKCPFILNIYNTFLDEKNVFLLLELCEGGDFYELVREQSDYKVKEADTKFYIACVVLGLTAMHERNIMYRDLKPENLMINAKGYIKIADFGLAKKSLRSFTVCGTPDYMAPETILSRGHDIGVDWWALGVLLYEVIQGETPFYGREQLQIYDNIIAHENEDDLEFHDEDTDITEECKSFIRKLLHPKKTRRLGNIKSGLGGILIHPFFTGFEWEKLSSLEMKPSLMPQEMAHNEKYKTMHPVDDDGYDPEFYNAPDDMSGWDPDF